MLLIHGWTLDLEMWEPQVRALCRSFRIIRYDRRGFGLSSGRPSLADDVSDARTLCRHLQLHPVAVLGMSQGARVAAHLAAASPGKVSCVVFDGAPSGIFEDEEPAESDIPITHYRALVRSGAISDFRQAWCTHPLMRLRTADVATHRLLSRMLERYPARDLRESDPVSSPMLAPLAAGAIQSPALVISGALDLSSGLQAADRLARAISASQREIVPDAGHLPNLDNPRVYNEQLRRFLTRFAS